MHMCTGMCRGDKRSTADVSHSHSSLYFLRQRLSLNLEFTASGGLAGWPTPQTPCPVPTHPSVLESHTCCTVSGFYVGTRDPNPGLPTPKLYQSRLPLSPKLCGFYSEFEPLSICFFPPFCLFFCDMELCPAPSCWNLIH